MIDENYNWGLINEINEAITEELGISDKVIELSDNIYIEIVKAFNSEKSTIIENGVGRKYGWITYPLDDNIILNISYDIINFANKKYMEEIGYICKNIMCIFLVDNKFVKTDDNYQFALDILNYVINNYNKIDSNEYFDVYSS